MNKTTDNEFLSELQDHYDFSIKPVPDREIYPQQMVLTARTKETLHKIAFLLQSGENVLLVGDAGVGKNALLYYLNALRNVGTIRYSFNQEIIPEEVLGSFSVRMDNGKIQWCDGGLTEAIKRDLNFIADELNLCTPDLLKRFSSLLANGCLELYEKDSSVLEKGQFFAFLATQNPLEGFEGRKVLPREISRLFSTIYIQPFSNAELLEILEGLYTISKDLLQNLVAIVSEIESKLHSGDLGYGDFENYHFNLRNLKRICHRIKAYDDHDDQHPPANAKAAKNNYLVKPDSQYLWYELWDVLASGFRKSEDWDLISDIMGKYFPNQSRPIVESITLAYQPDQIRIGRATLPINPIPTETKKTNESWHLASAFPLCRKRGQYLEQIAAAINMTENILLEGCADAELEGYVQWLATILNRPYHEITIGRESSMMDLIGSIRPVENKSNKGASQNLRWVDGPLTRAIKEDAFIVLRGIELAGAEVLEKLNMLTDDARMLHLPAESGNNAPLCLGEYGRIFAINYIDAHRKGKKISRAFRNRFTAFFLEEITEKADLSEMLFHYLEIDKRPGIEKMLETMALFHITAKDMAFNRRIGAENNVPYEFGWQNLRRWADALIKWQSINYRERLIKGAELFYISQISQAKDQALLLETLQAILADPDLDLQQLLDSKDIFLSDKKNLIDRYFQKNQNLEKKKPDSSFGSRKARYQSRGPKRHKGLNFKSPETGGNIKEGENAFYGKDTAGFGGYGEGGTGGGGMAYRSEDLLNKVRRNRKNLWDYHIGITLADFNKTFYSDLERLIIDLSSIMEMENPPKREFRKQGSRVHFSRFLAAQRGQQGRIFEKRIPPKKEDDEQPAVLFLVNKGRRIFNFDFAFEAIVTIFAAAKVLDYLPIKYGLWGYSNFNPTKSQMDFSCFKSFNEKLGETNEMKLFDNLVDKWEGRTIQESHPATQIRDIMPVTSRKKLLVWCSDFRGEYSKKYDTEYTKSKDFLITAQTLHELRKNKYEIILLGVGTRTLAPWLDEKALLVTKETIVTLPEFLIKEIVRRIV